MLRKVEDVELRAELAVIARSSLIQTREIRVKILFRIEGGAVDPGQLRLRRVAAPVRAGEARQLHRFDRLRVLEMRATAEVGDVALGRADELDLVWLALLLEAGLRLVARDLFTRPLAPFLQLAFELGLDL